MKKIKYILPLIVVILGGIYLENTFYTPNIKEKINLDDLEKSVNREIEKSNNIINIDSSYSLLYEPTIENLYENSSIVLIASFESELDTYVEGTIIRTDVKFKPLKIIKNSQNINIEKEIIVRTNGGTVPISLFEKSEKSLAKNKKVVKKFVYEKNKRKETRETFLESTPSYTLKDNTKYLLFLNIYNKDFYPSLIYHGIKEIQNNKVYNYLNKTFEETYIIKN